MVRAIRTSRALWVGLVVMTVLVAMPAWSATVPKAKFAKNAGKLDGLDSTAFASAGHAHGAGETMPVVLANDGAGSGVDADTLDGFDSATSFAPDAVYVSNEFGQLPTSTVDADSISNVGRAIRVPIHELQPAFTSGTFPQQVMVGDVPALAFDQTSTETVNFAFRLPNDVTPGPISLNLLWSTTATTGKVMWSVTVRAIDSIEVVDTGGFTNTILSESFAGVPAKRRNEETIGLGSSPSSIEASDLLVIRLARDAPHPDDTLTVDANLHAIELRYPADQ
jgi:hypothetical protein